MVTAADEAGVEELEFVGEGPEHRQPFFRGPRRAARAEDTHATAKEAKRKRPSMATGSVGIEEVQSVASAKGQASREVDRVLTNKLVRRQSLVRLSMTANP